MGSRPLLACVMTLSYYHGGVPHPGYNAGSKIVWNRR